MEHLTKNVVLGGNRTDGATDTDRTSIPQRCPPLHMLLPVGLLRLTNQLSHIPIRRSRKVLEILMHQIWNFDRDHSHACR